MVTKKVVILCSMLVLLLVLNLGNLSAWEFDNAKDYDVETKEVTIKNAFGLGSDVAKIKLNTPQNVVVPRGYQKVAEFDLIHLKNDNGGLNLIEFYNTKTSMSKFEREFDFKVKGTEQIDVNDYETICNDVWNETSKNMSKSCINKIIGTHKEDKVVWNDYDFKSLVKEEKITIGIFTDVQKGDKVEWIPTFYGVEIEEWATWTESTPVTEAHGIGIGGQQGGNNEGMAFTTKGNSGGYHMTEAKVHDAAEISHICVCEGIYKDNGTGCITNALQRSATSFDTATFDLNLTAGTKYYVIACGDSPGTETYSTSPNPSYPIEGVNLWWNYSAPNEKTTRMYFIESIKISNWTQVSNPPTVTLNSPEDVSTTSTPTNIFNCSASDDTGITNVSLLINNSIVSTNTSGLNNTDYIFPYTLQE